MDNTINKNDLVRKMQEIQFCTVDLNLFLDTHPDDAQAVQDYNYLVHQLNQYQNLYIQTFGPFMNFGQSAVNGNVFSWVNENEKWPWEGTGV